MSIINSSSKNENSPTPEKVLDIDDPGDDVRQRFLYQDICTAIFSVGLLSSSFEYEEIYCEHHEDILLKRKDGKFSAIQVKTRNVQSKKFKSKDKQVIKSLRRFIQFEKKFPYLFVQYEFLTNYVFWRNADTSSNIFYLLGLVKDVKDMNEIDEDNYLIDFLNILCFETSLDNKKQRTKRIFSEKLAFNMLKKLRIIENFASFDYIFKSLVIELSSVFGLNRKSIGDLKIIARELLNKIQIASATTSKTPFELYLKVNTRHIEESELRIINEKTITPDIVKEIIQKYDSCIDLSLNINHFSIEKSNPVIIASEFRRPQFSQDFFDFSLAQIVPIRKTLYGNSSSSALSLINQLYLNINGGIILHELKDEQKLSQLIFLVEQIRALVEYLPKDEQNQVISLSNQAVDLAQYIVSKNTQATPIEISARLAKLLIQRVDADAKMLSPQCFEGMDRFISYNDLALLNDESPEEELWALLELTKVAIGSREINKFIEYSEKMLSRSESNPEYLAVPLAYEAYARGLIRFKSKSSSAHQFLVRAQAASTNLPLAQFMTKVTMAEALLTSTNQTDVSLGMSLIEKLQVSAVGPYQKSKLHRVKSLYYKEYV